MSQHNSITNPAPESPLYKIECEILISTCTMHGLTQGKKNKLFLTRCLALLEKLFQQNPFMMTYRLKPFFWSIYSPMVVALALPGFERTYLNHCYELLLLL